MTSETRLVGGPAKVALGGVGGSGRKPRPPHPPPVCPQVKEMSLIRNTIMECQVCGEWERRGGRQVAPLCSPYGFGPYFR